jgi:hypothetical protein
MSFTDIQKRVWTGFYRGINYEINENDYLVMGKHWCFYIFIVVDNMIGYKGKSLWSKKGYQYDKVELINQISFHGGCTWYSKEYREYDHKEVKIVQLGCDYLHGRDINRSYDVDEIIVDVKRAIDSFYELVPKYKGDN